MDPLSGLWGKRRTERLQVPTWSRRIPGPDGVPQIKEPDD